MKKWITNFLDYWKSKNWFNNKFFWIGFVLIIFGIFLICVFNNREVTLSCAEVEKIVLNDLNGGTVTSCSRDGSRYEVEAFLDHYEYEFIVDGNSGKIISYDSDHKD